MVSWTDNIVQWLDRIEPSRPGDDTDNKNRKHYKHIHKHTYRHILNRSGQYHLSPSASSSYLTFDHRRPSHPNANISPDQEQEPHLGSRRRRPCSCSTSMSIFTTSSSCSPWSSPPLRTPSTKRQRRQTTVTPGRDLDGDNQQQTGSFYVDGNSDDGHDDGSSQDRMGEADAVGEDPQQDQDYERDGDVNGNGDQMETPRPFQTAIRRGINTSTNNAIIQHQDARPHLSPTKRPRSSSSLTKRPRRKQLTDNSSSSMSGSVFMGDGDRRDSASNTSRRSGASSSPTKHIVSMELDPNGLEVRPFSLDDARIPKSLAGLLAEMEDCGNGQNVLPCSQRVSYSFCYSPVQSASQSLVLHVCCYCRLRFYTNSSDPGLSPIGRDCTSGKD